jgi:hypothetical protein
MGTVVIQSLATPRRLDGWLDLVDGGVLANVPSHAAGRTPCNAMPPPVPAAIKTAGGIKKVVAEWERSSPAPPTCEISRTGRCSSTCLCATGRGGCWIPTLSFLFALRASRRAVEVDALNKG